MPRLALFRAVAVLAALLLGASGWSGDAPVKNQTLVDLKPNAWLKFHEQKTGEPVVFMRQAHGGSCFDTKRNRVVLFGSNTHSKDWQNSPFFFDPVKCEWTQAYPEDKPATYTVNEEGLPVAGEKGDHPWATHTFGTLEYDSERDELVVPITDEHMRPDKWGSATKALWPKIKKHPTWVYSLEKGTWTALPCKPESFFPHSGTYSPDNKAVYCYRTGGIWELSGEPREWKNVAKGSFFGWHNNSVWDAKNKKMVIFGSNQNLNDVAVFDPADKSFKLMPTPGLRPPKDQHNPMAFYATLGQTVFLVDKTKQKDGADADTTETWCYDLAKDAWTQVPGATLPFACGMNFNMEYDPLHDCLLLVTGGYGGDKTKVWALKIDLATAAAPAESK